MLQKGNQSHWKSKAASPAAKMRFILEDNVPTPPSSSWSDFDSVDMSPVEKNRFLILSVCCLMLHHLLCGQQARQRHSG